MRTLTEMMLSVHKPDLINTETHVCIVYTDGEIVSTKAGELFGQRGMHQIAKPIFDKNYPCPNDIPLVLGHAGVIVESGQVAWALRLEMFQKALDMETNLAKIFAK